MRYLIILSAILIFSAPAHSAIWYVPSDYSTIQAAINAAAHGDTIIVEPGTYVENIDFLGKAITVKSEEGPDDTVIDGGQPIDPDYGSVVLFQSWEGNDSVLEGFTLTNGTGTLYDFQGLLMFLGGGISCRNHSSPTIRDNIITNNQAIDPTSGSGGGGIQCIDFSSPLIENNVISDNVANWGGGVEVILDSSPLITSNMISGNEADAYHGGGIHIQMASPTIIDNEISGNKADSGDGGGIRTHVSSSLIQNNTITDNSSYWVGGVALVDGDLLLSNNFISGNSAVKGAGGVCCYYNMYSPIVEDNIITNNTASIGGGIWVMDSAPTIMNNHIEGNSVVRKGGGIFFYASEATVVNNTIVENTADEETGGGIDITESSSVTMINNTLVGNSAPEGGGIACRKDSTATVVNTILWDNYAPSGPEISLESSTEPSTLSISHSCVEGGQAMVAVKTGCILNWGSGMIDADPFFLDPYNGDFRLTYASPCIDAGNNETPSLPDHDFEGDPRIFPGNGKGVHLAGFASAGAIVDMGSDEYCLTKKQMSTSR
jgi:parallel beta-helix repeat protein